MPKNNAGFEVTHDLKDFKAITQILLDEIADLSEWSVYNDDKYSDEIATLSNTVTDIRQQEL